MLGRLAKIAIGIGLNTIRSVPYFINDYFNLKKQFNKEKKIDQQFPITGFYPALADRFAESGHLIKHYFQQDLHVARRIFDNKPSRHVDIGSRIDGFVAHVASYRPIEILDIRPLEKQYPNIQFRQADLMNMPVELHHYCDSISSLHAIEHFGLGRYGDPIDINGHTKALQNIYNILKPGGVFYFSSPIGPQRIIYNAHRVFSISYLNSLFEPYYIIKSFSFIDDHENFNEDVELTSEGISSNFGCTFGCGIFELIKKA